MSVDYTNISIEDIVNSLDIYEKKINYISEGKQEKYRPHVLPLEFKKGQAHTYFQKEEEVLEVAVGFKFQNKYYHFTEERKVEETEREDGVYYLPLNKIKTRINLVKNEKGVNKVIDGSPFDLISVDKESPFILAIWQKKKSPYLNSFYLNSEDQLEVYNMNNTANEQDVKKFFHLRFKKMNFAYERKFTPLIFKRNLVNKEDINLYKPKEIHAYLNRFIVGQEEAKITFSVGLSQICRRRDTAIQELPLQNILLIGPTASGKTKMMVTGAELAGLPYSKVAVSAASGEGYIGASLSTGFLPIIESTESNEPFGILCLDEIDKLVGEHNFGESKEQAIIGWMGENGTVTLEKHTDPSGRIISTKNILFIGTGAFYSRESNSSLYEIVEEKVRGGKTLGFNTFAEKEEGRLRKVSDEDLIKFGLAPELIGRFKRKAVLKELTEEERIRILTETEDSPLKAYSLSLELSGYKLIIRKGVAEKLVQLSSKETGTRALESICAEVFTPIEYSPEDFATGDKIVLTEKLIEKIIKN